MPYIMHLNVMFDWKPIDKRVGDCYSFDIYLEKINAILNEHNGQCIVRGDKSDRSREIIGFKFDTEQDYLMFRLCV